MTCTSPAAMSLAPSTGSVIWRSANPEEAATSFAKIKSSLLSEMRRSDLSKL